MKQNNNVSRYWWVLPILFGVIGGIIAWIFTRKKRNKAWIYIIGGFIVPWIFVTVIITSGIIVSGTYPFLVRMEGSAMEPHLHHGDVIFLIGVDRTEIITWAEGLETGYTSFGDYGDVIVYHPNGNEDELIISRAMVWIEIGMEMPNGQISPHSGYITKGDHNPVPDQPTLTMPVKKEWIVGVAKFNFSIGKWL